MLIKSASSTELGSVANALKGKNPIGGDPEQLETRHQSGRDSSEPRPVSSSVKEGNSLVSPPTGKRQEGPSFYLGGLWGAEQAGPLALRWTTDNLRNV